jgi:hypothetical protein
VDLAGAPPISSQAFWDRPERVVASQDPDTATAQTIQIMCQHVKAGAADALVQQAARDAVSKFSELRPGAGVVADLSSNEARVASAAWWWCKVYVRFVHHDFIIRQRLGETGHLQGLISPEVLVRMNKPEGDCAIFSECVAAFLTVFGIPYEFVTVAVNPQEPEIFSHVYLYGVLPDGSRLPLDASHGVYPGWQVPSAHVSRRQVWDANGNPVEDRGSRFDGLHNYGMRGLGTLVCDDMGCYDDGTGAVSSGAQSPDYGVIPQTTVPAAFATFQDIAQLNPGAYVTASGAPATGAAATAPAQNSAQWANFATSLAKMGFTLAQINAIQPGTVVSANGAILRQNPGYAVGTPTTGTLNLGGLSTSTLLIAALVIGGVFMMSKGGR